MSSIVITPPQRTPEFIQYVHLVWGYGELIDRALLAGEDPSPLVAAVVAATERAAQPEPHLAPAYFR